DAGVLVRLFEQEAVGIPLIAGAADALAVAAVVASMAMQGKLFVYAYSLLFKKANGYIPMRVLK
ncbi:hypothetical protein, partial [Chitinilyticum litopenaei]|uniref:hypothetical protein n=1 Tax=Chitinilyticum litopenaei TaxID=1121276 RepID=UPI0005B80DD2